MHNEWGYSLFVSDLDTIPLSLRAFNAFVCHYHLLIGTISDSIRASG